MSIRTHFDNELMELKERLLEMVSLAKNAVEEAMVALANQDINKAQQIIKDDEKINEYDEKINQIIVQLIAKQQPVATDLRKLIAALKITNDVERIGDLAVNISKSILHIGNTPMIKPIEEIPKMAGLSLDMLSNMIRAYIDEDVALAKVTAEMDDELDEQYGKLIHELVILMTKHPESIIQLIQLSYICRFIERLGDHTTNIAEHIIYMIKGKKYDLNH